MTQIVSIHSYRGGTGKSNLTANLATTMALLGKRVGIVDTDIQSPGIHILFNVRTLINHFTRSSVNFNRGTAIRDRRKNCVSNKAFVVPCKWIIHVIWAARYVGISGDEIVWLVRNGVDGNFDPWCGQKMDLPLQSFTHSEMPTPSSALQSFQVSLVDFATKYARCFG